jgi:hypothetical protein
VVLEVFIIVTPTRVFFRFGGYCANDKGAYAEHVMYRLERRYDDRTSKITFSLIEKEVLEQDGVHNE